VVSSIYFHHLARIVEDMGADRPGLSDATGIDFDQKPNPKIRYNLDQFEALFRYGERALDDPHIGLNVSKAFRISTYPGPSSIWVFCKNIEEAVTVGQRYAVLVHNVGFPHVVKEAQGAQIKAKFVWLPNYKTEEFKRYRQITEYVVGNYVHTINWLAWGFGRGVEKVSFAHAREAPLAPYERIFGCEVEFGAPEHVVTLADGVIDRPLPTANRRKFIQLRTQLEGYLASFNRESDLIIQVESKIRETMEYRKPSLALIASDLGLQERTLRRHLNEQDTRFKTLVEGIRKELCVEYLDEGMPLSEIAQSLWYSEQSAFTRAYKNWYGTSPAKHNRRPARG
jgi:AraC-like DNA-binding protein